MESLLDSQTSSRFIFNPLYSAAAGVALLLATGTGLYLSTQDGTTASSVENTKEFTTSIPGNKSSLTSNLPQKESNQQLEDNTQNKASNVDNIESLENQNTTENLQKEQLFENNSTFSNPNVVEVANVANNNFESQENQIRTEANNSETSEELQNMLTESISSSNREAGGQSISFEDALKLSKLSPILHEGISSNDEKLLENSDNFIILDSFKLPKSERHYFGIMAGANMSQAYQTPTNSGSSFSPNVFGGVTYKYVIGNKLALNANLLYQSRGDVNTQKQFIHQNYDFGFQVDTTTVSAQKLHYIEAPIYLDYLINGKHNLIGGMSASYLVESSSDVNVKSNNNFDSWEENSTEFGHNDGFERLDVAVIAGYEYFLKPDLNVGIRMNYGLIDATKDHYFNNSLNNNNLQFRFYLKYKLFGL